MCEEDLVELPHSPLFVHSQEGGVGLDLVSISSSLEMSNGDPYVGIVSGKGFNDGDVFVHRVLPFVIRGIEKIFYKLGILEPNECFMG